MIYVCVWPLTTQRLLMAYSRFRGAADMYDPPPRLISVKNDPLRKSGGPKCCDARDGFSTMW
jgi:hypothetical protein